MIGLLAQHARGYALPQRQRDTEPLPASAPAPLAA
jgi:hypothetical protein